MSPSIVWFRQDLRLTDNPALQEAARCGGGVIPLFIAPAQEGLPWACGSASRWWLHHSLASLRAGLQKRGSRLIIREGGADTLLQVAEETGAERILWNRLYEPGHVERDHAIKARLQKGGLIVRSFNSALLHEPWEIKNSTHEAYRVFTPYWRAVQRLGLASPPIAAPPELPPVSNDVLGLSLDALELLPKIPWDTGLRESWNPGEKGALEQLEQFLGTGLAGYEGGRNRPDRTGTSRLSPHLHFGEIGPRQVVAAVNEWVHREPTPGLIKAGEAYLRELVWREFAYHLLFHFPTTAEDPLDPRFRCFPWADDYESSLPSWQQGLTGYPLVDAGMRELRRTGWMHNRVRMVVASLLTKNQRIPWQEGARWFWDTLVDADLANNTLGWQWSAGCGADAAPYFRIFNPVLQGQRFDPVGDYVRKWIPELSGLPHSYIHQPWAAPPLVLADAKVELGRTYPWPIIDLKQSRDEALAAFSTLRRSPTLPGET